MYRAVTRNIEVTVEPYYRESQSDPADSRYVWGYRVIIVNHSDTTVQLLTRYWQITNESGSVDEVRGDGVVGEQPVLHPGDSYQYASGCPLETPSGVMRGNYGMSTASGERFDVEIPAFSLDVPGQIRTLN